MELFVIVKMDQTQALNVLMSCENVFLTGEPGSGKTHTISLFMDNLKSIGVRYAFTASTGLAASHLDGRTIHSLAGIGISRNIKDSQARSIANKPWIKECLTKIDVLIIDEISMLDAVTLTDVDNVVRYARRNLEQPFGGLQVVLVGDFFQLPPVPEKGEEPVYAFESEVWQELDLKVCYLNEQHRQSDIRLEDILASIRSGEDVSEEYKEIIRNCSLNTEPETHLYTHRRDVDAMNRNELAKLPGDTKIYVMRTAGDERLIIGLKKNCPSPERLMLKVGAVVMFTRNETCLGYVNGTIGKVIQIDDNDLPVVETVDGKEIQPEMATWSVESCNGQGVKICASITQVPLKLAWAITVHKSQGMSLDQASIDLNNAFVPGQGYVAISRVRNLDGLHVQGANEMTFRVDPKVVEFDKELRS